jgi:hypothetical protein
MRSVTRLIDQIRNQTENEDFSDFVGIKDSEFVQYLNDAQYNLQSAIVHQHPRVFIAEEILQATAGVESYALPSDCFLGNKVHNVEYSATGSEDDYYVLEQDNLKRRAKGSSGYPSRYIRMSGKIMLTPLPQSSGKIRVSYVRRLPELQIKKAEVKQIYLNSVAVDQVVDSQNEFTITLDDDAFTTEIADLQKESHICVIDKHGDTLITNIPIVSVTSTTITCSAHTLKSGQSATIPAGASIVGKDATTHSELSIETERYLISYVAWKILKRDSSVDSQEAFQELSLMQQEIVKSYAVISDDIQYIPQLNSWDDWSY